MSVPWPGLSLSHHPCPLVWGSTGQKDSGEAGGHLRGWFIWIMIGIGVKTFLELPPSLWLKGSRVDEHKDCGVPCNRFQTPTSPLTSCVAVCVSIWTLQSPFFVLFQGDDLHPTPVKPQQWGCQKTRDEVTIVFSTRGSHITTCTTVRSPQRQSWNQTWFELIQMAKEAV